MCQHEQLLDIQAAIFKQLFMLTHTERLLWRRLSDGADFALQTRVECRAAEHKLCLVGLRWRTHEGEVVLSLPMGLKEEKAEELAVYA